LEIGLFSEAYLPIVSGVVTSTRLLAAEYLRRGHGVHLYTPRYPGWHADEPIVRRFPSINFPIKSWIPVTVPYSAALYRDIRRAGLSVYHTQQPFIMGRVARHLARERGVPLVCTVHTQYEQYVHYCTPGAYGTARAVARALVRSFCNSCDAITTPAGGMLRLLRGYGVTRPIHVIPNGLDLLPYQRADGAAVRARWGISPGSTLFVFVGRLAKEKNLPTALKALAILRSRGRDAVLMLVGDGPERDVLRQRADEHGLGSAALFVGRVEHRETPAYYAAADAFLTPSTTEVNPYTVIEAMAGGAPVVAVDSFGMREILTDGEDALLVGPEPEALANAMEMVAANPDLRAKMAEAARRKAEDYSIVRCADRMLEVYSGVTHDDAIGAA
jgi:glycosyltransferase involved in cell wall biosynthesis